MQIHAMNKMALGVPAKTTRKHLRVQGVLKVTAKIATGSRCAVLALVALNTHCDHVSFFFIEVTLCFE